MAHANHTCLCNETPINILDINDQISFWLLKYFEVAKGDVPCLLQERTLAALPVESIMTQPYMSLFSVGSN